MYLCIQNESDDKTTDNICNVFYELRDYVDYGLSVSVDIILLKRYYENDTERRISKSGLVEQLFLLNNKKNGIFKSETIINEFKNYTLFPYY